MRLLTALAFLGISTAAFAQSLGPPARSTVPEENALFAVLERAQLKGTGQNGVPAGMTVYYKLSNPNHCAPALQPWVTASGAAVNVAAGPPVSLRIHAIDNLATSSENHLVIIYKDGTRQPVFTSSPDHRNALVAAIQSYGAYCLKQPPPPPEAILMAPSSAQPAPAVQNQSRPQMQFASKRAAQKAFADILMAFEARGSGGYKMSLGRPENSCATRLVFHIPAYRTETYGDMSEPRDDVVILDWAKADKRPEVKEDGPSIFFQLSKTMSSSSHWPKLIYLPPDEAVPFFQAVDHLTRTCAPGLYR